MASDAEMGPMPPHHLFQDRCSTSLAEFLANCCYMSYGLKVCNIYKEHSEHAVSTVVPGTRSYRQTVTELYRLSPVLLLLLDIGPIQTQDPYSSNEGTTTTKQQEAAVMLLPPLLLYQIAQHAVALQAAHASTHCCKPAELGHSSISAAASTTQADRNNCLSPPVQGIEACPVPKTTRTTKAM